MGRVLHLGPSWHGPSFKWAEVAWAELVLGRVVLHPFLCILGSFLRLNIQNGGYIFGLLKFQILFFWGGGGCLKFQIFLGG